MKKYILGLLLSAGMIIACNSQDDNYPIETPPTEKYPMPSISSDNLFNIQGNNLLSITVEKDSLIRNPCMGWGIYDDAQDYVADASIYWMQMDRYARYASHIYIRWRWSEMEPEEGRYVWMDKNNNFNRLIKGALSRGLKLAFRVYYDSDGQHMQATPDYVREAGADGYWITGYAGRRMWSPYVDDPIFQQKLEKFVKAFALEFDDPDRVDFIDGFNLGWWGEGHHIPLKAGNNNATAKTEVVKWITNLYGNTFTKIPLVINYHNEIGTENLDWVVENQDYQLRHDAFGSKYYSTFERAYESKSRTKRMIVAESCYWFVGTDKGAASSGNVDFTEQWRHDNTYNPPATSWAQVYNRTYKEASIARANMLDMREEREASSWTKNAPDIVAKFIQFGGYRLTPVKISLPTEMQQNSTATIGHRWKNSGFGVCPNHNKRWASKYKVAFALIDQNEKQVAGFVDTNSEPGDWLQEKDTDYNFTTEKITLPPGKYYWMVGITDTSKNGFEDGLNLACKDLRKMHKWVVVAPLIIK